ncbi:hypothetical protein RchiOBHm_Chr5g0040101 [Rosa chinensis]|uniref:Uncharacterized protein n=1 Tax=Rosa chinensis TaxID=74649 RepID=A0A2P6QCH2_ROSCH|nr:hypothetical protein RchiOBHm_Chr5g0040101 [Rosa chinensis]
MVEKHGKSNCCSTSLLFLVWVFEEVKNKTCSWYFMVMGKMKKQSSSVYGTGMANFLGTGKMKNRVLLLFLAAEYGYWSQEQNWL